MRLSAYARGLKEPEKSRYEEKVRLCGGFDPLDLNEAEVKCDVNLLPRVDFTDIKGYLVHATSFITREQLKSYKALEARNYLTSGWVQEPRLKAPADSRVVIVGRGLRSQSLSEKPLHPWLLVKEDGLVQAAHCTCKAGLGEACCHIGAILFYIQAVVQRRDGQACTDKENAWLPPPVRSLEAKPVSGVSFSSSKMKKRVMDGETPCREKLRRVNVQPTTDEKWSEFLSACHQSGSRPALLSLEPKYAHHFIPAATKFPSAILTNMQQDDQPTTWSSVMERCCQLAESATGCRAHRGKHKGAGKMHKIVCTQDGPHHCIYCKGSMPNIVE
ncbi:uncharacterized protein LOC142588943 [Dermacentor variabilis]|uniref:uncharacterized protein LOC142588943 n=1 Tax=Dermacentor variabilis TaxID=34621 RepID=UPI003F5B29A7